MQVIVAKNSGFCRGVKHAVDTAMTIPAENTYVLGEIIHNAEVVEAINKRGLKVVESLSEIPDGATVIFRSHGVPLSYYEECGKRNIEVVDCTCQFVNSTQRIVKREHDRGSFIVICGEPTHPEVIGLQGWCENSALVVSDAGADLSAIPDGNVCVVAQTTFSVEKFEEIIKNIKKLCEKIVAVFKTICYTTISRQKEAYALSSECDAMIVIGGLNSSNTNKLYDLCAANCRHVIRLANAGEFDFEKIKNFNKIGIVSGASTPNAQTREVLLKMENTEVNAANSMAEVVAKIDSESKFKKGQIVQATISEAKDDGLQILLPFSKKEILLSKDELDCEVYNPDDYASKLGDAIDLMVVELNPLKLSQKKIRTYAEEEKALAEIEGGKEFKAVCSGSNKGGLVAQVGTFSVFIPAKEVRPGYVKDLTKYVGKTLRLRAIEIKREKRRKEIIASQRVILEEERAAKAAEKARRDEEFFDAISVGDIVEGKVERATAFGAFVSVGGFDCLAHISDLSWSSVKAVTDVLEIGKTYHFKVLKIDRENKKVSIGYKQLQPEPWDLAGEKYHVGEIVHGKVVRLAAFGAFVEVEKGVDGLVHVSQIARERVETPADVLTVGQEVDAKIIVFDVAARKMNLSIKACLPEEEKKPKENKGEGGEASFRRGRAPKKDDGELSNWSEGSISVGTSLGDILAEAKKNQ